MAEFDFSQLEGELGDVEGDAALHLARETHKLGKIIAVHVQEHGPLEVSLDAMVNLPDVHLAFDVEDGVVRVRVEEIT